MGKKKKFLILGIVVLCILMITGVSFAIWQINLQQTTENVITTGCFKIEFRDINPINLEKAYPITDEEGASLVPYEFTITNACNSYASYQINLEILNTSTLENLEFLKVMLEDKTNLLTENENVTKTLENAKTSYKLKNGYLRENQSKTFSLRLWLDENTPTREEFMNKLFESKVTVIATYKENLDNNIEVSAISQNESFSSSETFQIHATSENYDLVAISEDLETWEELETKGKDITIEKTVTTNGSHTFYFQDEAENVKEVIVVSSKIDDKKPVANMNVVKENNVIKIDASSSLDHETSISKYYYSKDGINYEESSENKFQYTNEYEYGVATTMLTNFEKNQIQKVYLKVEDEVGNASDVKAISITESDFAYDETSDNNLRYIGANPNNYVSFNDELWRIIGVMNNIDDGTGKKETRIKLIRNESIGNYSWDTSASTVNGGYGINEWSQADVKTLLNEYYYNGKFNQICYNGLNNATIQCDFSNIGLDSNIKRFIKNAVWLLGSNGKEKIYNNILTSSFYTLERGINTGKICTNGDFCNDNVIRTTKWLGNIGLIYPSDYGYSTSGKSIESRNKCLKTILYDWSSSADCYNNSWLYDNSFNYWTITSAADSTGSRGVFVVSSNGRIDQGAAIPRAVFPVFYLISEVKITSGKGSLSDPFSFGLD